MTPEQKKANLRLALVLASIALIFFVGFVAKSVLLPG
ncbi:MAG: cytochrome oxidase small assembly protein [Caldimonas sp.]